MNAQVQTSPTGDERVKVWFRNPSILHRTECSFHQNILHPWEGRKVKNMHHTLHPAHIGSKILPRQFRHRCHIGHPLIEAGIGVSIEGGGPAPRLHVSSRKTNTCNGSRG